MILPGYFNYPVNSERRWWDLSNLNFDRLRKVFHPIGNFLLGHTRN